METPETIFKTWMSRVWNQLDVAAIDELMAPQAPVHGLGEDPLNGAAGFKEFHAAFVASFDEMHFDVHRQVVQGNQVAAHWSGSMVHKASGKSVPASGMAILRCRDGQIQESWNSADFLPMLITLGIVPGDAMNRALS